MKIAFPTEADMGLDGPVFGHFCSAPNFIIVDSNSGDFESIGNTDLHHAHGQCEPLRALDGRTVDAVVVGGIGGGALRKLGKAGVKTFRAIEGTVQDNLNLLQSGKLPEFGMFQTCAGHGPDHHCSH